MKPRAAGLGLCAGAGDGNRTRALSLGITWRSVLIMPLNSGNECWRQATAPAAAAVVGRCLPLYLVRLWCGGRYVVDQAVSWPTLRQPSGQIARGLALCR